jgi:hypothetical protein
MKTPFTIAILAVVVASVPSGTAVAASAVDLGPPLKIFGCVPGPDAPAFKTCVENAVQELVSDAAADAGAAMESQIDTLSGQLAATNEMLEQATAALQAPLVQALSQGQASELHDCLAEQGVNLPQTMNQVLANPTQFVQGRFNALWQQGMQSAARMIQLSMPAATGSHAAPSVSLLLDRTEEVFDELAGSDPVARCTWTMVAPFRAQAKAMVMQIQPMIRAHYDQMVTDVLQPALDRALLEILEPMVAQFAVVGADAGRTLTTGSRQIAVAGGKALRAEVAARASAVPEDVRRIAIGVAHRHLLNSGAMQRVTDGVQQLAGTVTSNPAGAGTALQNLEKHLQSVTTFSDRIALEVGIETMRFYGHALIDTRGQQAVTAGFAGAQAAKDVVIEVITGVVALFWEPAEAIGELVAGCVEVVIDVGVQPPAEMALIAAAHENLDSALDQAHRAMREQKPPSHYLQNAGPFAALLSQFPTEAELITLAVPELAAMRDTLFAYHQSVRNLARAAADAGGAVRSR